jgi:hypothetical protein
MILSFHLPDSARPARSRPSEQTTPNVRMNRQFAAARLRKIAVLPDADLEDR